MSIAWADGEYDPKEQALIEDLIRSEWPQEEGKTLDPLSPEALAAQLQPEFREDFLRTAVMTAVADGVYSESEDQLLHRFATALGLELPQLDLLKTTLATSEAGSRQTLTPIQADAGHPEPTNLLDPLRHWMDGIQVRDPRVARFLCRMIPSQCPFEQDVVVFGHKVMHIPPMCKLNPLYDQVVGLRFRALSLLAEKGEDTTQYV
ncbi:TerB family tellurite resistance protein [Synechococcus bigranulatus str. 'Rupite']|uniref:TerB family tellurite resistance protein n=1 Tax=Thermostichus vulcanus str. 'Rupite' TaxID=2813851 RepID=A0ABT0CBG6_THEVL|nr:TerB family tellurite resistance protein [Thermostichus vulcanus str. 'Rupite']